MEKRTTEYEIPVNMVYRKDSGEWHFLNPENGTHIQELKVYHCEIIQNLRSRLNLNMNGKNYVTIRFVKHTNLIDLFRSAVYNRKTVRPSCRGVD